MVKALDSKSNGLCPRRFESCSVRWFTNFFFFFSPLLLTGTFFPAHTSLQKKPFAIVRNLFWPCTFKKYFFSQLTWTIDPNCTTYRCLPDDTLLKKHKQHNKAEIRHAITVMDVWGIQPRLKLTLHYFPPPDKPSRSADSFHWSTNTNGCSQTTATPHKHPALQEWNNALTTVWWKYFTRENFLANLTGIVVQTQISFCQSSEAKSLPPTCGIWN